MSKKQKKYYVVWEGRTPGIFDQWDKCKASIDGYPQAKYKSFINKETAELAYFSDSKEYIGKVIEETSLSAEELKLIGKPIQESIAVDGAWNTASGAIEYRGVYLLNNKELFKQGPFADGTNNIAEFLAIVHALAFCKEKKINLPIYSDSRNAISWVKYKNPRTNQKPTVANKVLFEMLDRAVQWLHTNNYPNQILKWETKAWGENPADFGRK